jgi:CBS domain-containing protein
MLACVMSVILSRQLHAEAIYTEHLQLKGISLRRESEQAGAALDKTVGDLMRPPVPPLRENVPFHEITDRFIASSNNFFPVVNARQQLIGVVALQDLKEFLNDNRELSGVIAYDVMRPTPKCLTPDQRLLDALPLVLESEIRNVPVVNSLRENRLVGSISRAEVLAIFSEAIAEKSDPRG